MDLIGGRFELREPIASGGTSTVWRAFDHELGSVCAAKVLRMRDAGGLMRFAREQSRRLVGHHLVTPYAWVADDGTALIAFELLPGGSLRTLIGDYGPLADATIVAILDQLLDALEGVHAAGIVHRDVKPGNVLLRATGDGPLDLALADFGIAIAFTDARLTIVGTVIGTPGYMPPEVLRGEATPEESHDLFALGRVAVALVLGHENGTCEEALELIKGPALSRTVRALNSPDPAARPVNVQEVRQLLAGAVRDPLPRERDGEPITVFDQVGPGDDAGRYSGGMDADLGGSGAGTNNTGTSGRNPDPESAGAGGDLGAVNLVDHRGNITENSEDPEPGDETTPMFRQPRPILEQSQAPTVPSGPDQPIISTKSAQSENLRGANTDSGGRVVPRPGKPVSFNWRRVALAITLVVAGIISFAIWNSEGDKTPVIPTDNITEPLAPGEKHRPHDPGKATPTVAVPKENAPNVGDTCTWLTEGDREISSSGTPIQCQLIDGEYVWRAP